MKKFFALLATLAVIVVSTCCSPKKVAPIGRAPDVTMVVAWRDFEITLHACDAFDPHSREILEEGAANIRRLTRDRARIHLAYDLDFDSLEGLKAHRAAAHSTIVPVFSWFNIAKALDAANKAPGTLMAVTAHEDNGATIVVFILDRIDPERAGNTVTHEFGHVIGLPDLPTLGAIMSGSSIEGSQEIPDWTPADVQLCRAYHYCD